MTLLFDRSMFQICNTIQYIDYSIVDKDVKKQFEANSKQVNILQTASLMYIQSMILESMIYATLIYTQYRKIRNGGVFPVLLRFLRNK